MSIKTVRAEITKAVQNNILSKAEAKRIENTAVYGPSGRKTPVTAGEFKEIESLYKRLTGASTQSEFVRALPSTLKIIEDFLIKHGASEDGVVTSQAVGEEDGDEGIRTMAIPEEGDAGTVEEGESVFTTMAIPEDGDVGIHTMAIPEEGDVGVTSQALGEEDGGTETEIFPEEGENS